MFGRLPGQNRGTANRHNQNRLSGAMYSIAIVDDNEAWGLALGIFLRQHGFSVSAFSNPEAFLRQAQEFDLALIDFSIPSRRYQREIDGPSLIARLKQQLDHPPLFVLISAYFTEEILQYPSDLCPEADVCLSKSAGLKEILQCVEKLLVTSRRPPVGQARRQEQSRNQEQLRQQLSKN